MNSVMLVSLIVASTGLIMLTIDHHYYQCATIACLEKKIQADYEAEGRVNYERACDEKNESPLAASSIAANSASYKRN